MLALERFLPRAPAPLIAVAGGIAGTALLGLQRHGVATVGQVPTGLPSPIIPDLKLAAALWPAGLGIALMSFTETIAAGRVFARPDEKPLANRELLATGLANLGGALLGAMPGGGGTSQTAVNNAAGARSQLAGLVTSGVALVAILLLAPYIGLMPEATLASIVIVYSVGLIRPAEFRAVLRIRRTEFAWALIALVGVVALGTLQGILVAIVASLLALAHQVSDPPVNEIGRKPGTDVFRARSAEHPDDETFPGLLIVRPEGRIFFANVDRVREKIQTLVATTHPNTLALDLRAVFDLEYTALKMLTEAEEAARNQGVQVWLVGLNPGVLAMVQHSPLGRALGRDNMFFKLEDVVVRHRAR